MKIGALFYMCKKNKSILSRKKIIVLVLHALHAVGTNVEVKNKFELNQKHKKKITNQKKENVVTISIGDSNLP